MADLVYTIGCRVRRGHLNALMQKAAGELRRARRCDRPALSYRWAQRMYRESFTIR